MTVFRKPSGGLVLHSPTPWNEDLDTALSRHGPVEQVLAPSLMHNLFLEGWAAHRPDAEFLAVPGFAARYPGLRVDAPLDDTTSIESLHVVPVGGMPKVQEHVVFHEPSRTLVVADLVFHFPRTDSWSLGLLLRLVGAHGGVKVSRLFRSMITDRAATRQSLDRILELPFERIVVGHGENVASSDGRTARDRLREAFTWLEP